MREPAIFRTGDAGWAAHNASAATKLHDDGPLDIGPSAAPDNRSS